MFVSEKLTIRQYRKNRQNMIIFAKQFNDQINIVAKWAQENAG